MELQFIDKSVTFDTFVTNVAAKLRMFFIYQNKNATFYQQALSFPFVIVKSLINR